MKKTYLLPYFILFSSYSLSQSNLIENLVHAPNEYSFQNTLNSIKMNEFSGKADIKFPLFDLELENNRIGYFLAYDTGGVKVEDYGSNIGTNWNFIGESRITREQHGLPDDLNSYIFPDTNIPLIYLILIGANIDKSLCLTLKPFENVGYLYSSETLMNDIKPINDFPLEVKTNPILVEGRSVYPSPFINANRYINNNIDSGPDKFNVMLPNGEIFSFVFDRTLSKMRVLDNDEYKIEYNLTNNDGFNKFIITDKKGYKFIFEDSDKAYLKETSEELNTSEGFPFTKFDEADNRPIYDKYKYCKGTNQTFIDTYKNKKWSYSWHLNEIISPSGQKIIYKYNDINILNIGHPLSTIIINKRTKDVISKQNNVFKTWISSKELKEIITPYSIVNFEYSDFRKDLISSGKYSTSKVLSNIVLRDKKNNSIIKRIVFKNDYIVSNSEPVPKKTTVDPAVYKRLFLNSFTILVNDRKVEEYKFNYYDAYELPNKQSHQIDHFGFYRPINLDIGESPNSFYDKGLFPNVVYNELLNPYSNEDKTKFKLVSNRPNDFYIKDFVKDAEKKLFFNKTYNRYGVLYGTLNEISDIRGKNTYFEYEVNRAFYQNTTFFTGGLRVKKIIEKSQKENLEYITEFEYGRKDNNNNIFLDTGVIANIPYFAYQDFTGNPARNVESFTISSKPFNVNENINTYYPIVIKSIKTPDGKASGKIVNEYSFFDNKKVSIPGLEQYFPNLYNTSYRIKYIKSLPEVINLNKDRTHYFERYYENIFPYSKNFDLSALNGHLINSKVYSQNSILLKEEKNIYNIDRINDYNKIYIDSYGGSIEKQFFIRYNLQETRLIEYSTPQDSVISSHSFNYDWNNSNLKTIVNKNSKNETIITQYQYPSDWAGNPIYDKLIDQNRISDPITITQLNNGNIISATYNEYSDFNGIVQKSGVFQKKGSDQFYETDRKITYNSYDIKGNITQYTLNNGIPVAIIWGYDGQYPIAKIEGVSYTDLTMPSNYTSNIINALIDQTTNYPQNTDHIKNLFNQLRINDICKNAMVTTYQYKPLIGVSSITQPNGQTEYYNYDTSNRLQSIVNDKGEVLKTFEYNYKQP